MAAIKTADSGIFVERKELDSFFINWHFFTPFFASILGLLIAIVFLFATSMGYLFDFYKQRQARETLATLQNTINKRQEYLRNYLTFIKDDADFKNAFYYASEEMISLQKPLGQYLVKYKTLLGVNSILAVRSDGRVIFSEVVAGNGGKRSTADLLRAFGAKQLPKTEIAITSILMDGIPHVVAAIPVRLFNKLSGHLLVEFDFGYPFLKELRGITKHDFMFLDSLGNVAVSTTKDGSLNRAAMAALKGHKSFPVEFNDKDQVYFIHALPILGTEKHPLTDLYVIGNISELEEFQARVIKNAIWLFAAIAAASFLVSFLSSKRMSRRVNRLLEELQSHRNRIEKQQKMSELGELAAQISHDIRSPLAALEIISGDVAQLPEDKRILIRSAVGRIRDIANSLLNKQHAHLSKTEGSGPAGTPQLTQEVVSPQLLSSLIEPLVTEKRLQFRARSRVEIEAWLDAASYGIFAKVQPVEFKRLLSNLIDNAVEAFGDGPGSVRVNLSARNNRAIVSVQDNGKGIPAEILAKLGQRGVSFGKAGGSGLGLHHARTSAESWGGVLEIVSEIGKGTTVSGDLPQAPAPAWFVSELALVPGMTVAILDDDASIHQVWQRRLDALSPSSRTVEIIHFSTPEDIRNWVRGNGKKAREALFLLDYELSGHVETGLSLADELGIGDRAVLVTSRYADPGILEGCRKLKTRLIPKGLAGLVPIKITAAAPAPGAAAERWDAVLIDDDPLTRMTWKMAADRAGKKFRAFPTAADFLKDSDAIDRMTPVYVDAELGDGVKGEVESLRIHKLGFGEIYLATGHAPIKFAGLTHLRGVVGKNPPWSDEG